ncbi:MAG TPA: hypothetical protein VFW28_13595 [Micropepsaceae bacterium]|nr:hypothetical protein [Micropepsaceae bacterium]
MIKSIHPIAPLIFAAAFICATSAAHAAAAPDVSGIWWTNSYSMQIRPQNGGAIPFTPAGAAAYRKNSAGLGDGSIVDTARKFCVPDGVPRILASPYPFQIFQSPGFTTIFYEQNHVIRTIPMDRPVASDEALAAYPYFSGNSFGHWENDTLVVVTKGFNEKTFVDASGVPHSDRLQVTERFRKINGGKVLEDVATIEDPVMFTRPWTTRFTYDLHPEVILDTSFTCGDKHRDISRVKGASQ